MICEAAIESFSGLKMKNKHGHMRNGNWNDYPIHELTCKLLTMGYTHYWYMKKDKKVSNKKWNKLTRDAKLLLDGSPILERAKQNDTYGDWIDLSITENMIRYDGGHETFGLKRNTSTEEEWVFNFCKTARKEYDGLVTATLLLAKHHLGDEIRLSSDGDEQEWAKGASEGVPSGYEFVKEILNETDAKAAFTATMADFALY